MGYYKESNVFNPEVAGEEYPIAQSILDNLKIIQKGGGIKVQFLDRSTGLVKDLPIKKEIKDYITGHLSKRDFFHAIADAGIRHMANEESRWDKMTVEILKDRNKNWKESPIEVYCPTDDEIEYLVNLAK